MTIVAIRLQNFMAFKDTGWIELRPITLLFGRNSSGKSAIIRALRLLKQSLDAPANKTPLIFESRFGVDIGSFREMVHNGQAGDHVTFHFRCTSAEIQDVLKRHQIAASPAGTRSDATLDFILGYAAHRQEHGDIDATRVELAELQMWLSGDGSQGRTLLFQAGLLEPEDARQLAEDWYAQGQLTEGGRANSWRGFGCGVVRGFLPGLVPPTDTVHTPVGYPCLVELVSLLNEEVSAFLGGLIHLGPIRPEPQRRYSFDRGTAYEWKELDWTAFLDLIGGDLPREKVEEISSWL